MPENDFPVEDKALFVRRINEALIECGAGRYDYLSGQPMEYEAVGGEEFVSRGNRRACVTGDSLAAVLQDICGQGVL